MLTSSSLRRIAFFASASLLVPVSLIAQSGETLETGTATITVEQTGPEEGVVGAWSFIRPDHSRVELKERTSHVFENTPAGSYTIIATPPSGAAAVVDVWLNGTKTTTADLPQITFTVGDGDSVRVLITFTYTRFGKVSASSDPPGLSFVIDGPNEMRYTGITPAEFLRMPEGLYSIQFDPIEGCVTPKPTSGRMVKDGRIDFSVRIVCDNLAESSQQQDKERALLYVNILVNGVQIVFDDVPMAEWFATYVHAALRTGIMSGYRDMEGKLTGKFGPGDHVTLSQLAKVAHEVAAIDELKDRTLPENLRARDTWFSDYYASAERLDWLVYRNVRDDPERPATRSEVVCTLLQVLDVERVWPTGERFTDVRRKTPYADCIETAARDGLITGDVDASGIAIGSFGPERPINRAEFSKMLSIAMSLYGEKSQEIQGNYSDEEEEIRARATRKASSSSARAR